ncbi:hypothetical protein GCM10009648_07340 [Tsukamurella spumae]
MYEQTAKPNLNVNISGDIRSYGYNGATWLGWCLLYSRRAFGGAGLGTSAWDEWQRFVKHKHADRNIPKGVYVPIWFDGWWDGNRSGHVAVYKDGAIYSSPYTDKASYDKLDSIEEVERIYGMKYVGWSEDIGGKRVIKCKEEVIMPKDQDVKDYFRSWEKREPTAAELKDYTGRTWRYLVDKLLGAQKKRGVVAQDQAAQLPKVTAQLKKANAALDAAAKSGAADKSMIEKLVRENSALIKKQEQLQATADAKQSELDTATATGSSLLVALGKLIGRK